MRFFYIFLGVGLFVNSISLLGCSINEEYKQFNKDHFKGDEVLSKDPAKGLNVLSPKEALPLIKNENYVFIDTRPASYFKKCKITNSLNYAYAIPGYRGNFLTKKIVNKLVNSGKTIVFYCNSTKCYRSLNASIQSCLWGIPTKKIKWLSMGVPGVVKISGKNMVDYVTGKGCKQFAK